MKEADETARGVVFQEGLAAEPLSFRLSGAEDDRPSLLANAGLHREVSAKFRNRNGVSSPACSCNNKGVAKFNPNQIDISRKKPLKLESMVFYTSTSKR